MGLVTEEYRNILRNLVDKFYSMDSLLSIKNIVGKNLIFQKL